MFEEGLVLISEGVHEKGKLQARSSKHAQPIAYGFGFCLCFILNVQSIVLERMHDALCLQVLLAPDILPSVIDLQATFNLVLEQTDGCTSLGSQQPYVGKAILIMRGNCSYSVKVTCQPPNSGLRV